MKKMWFGFTKIRKIIVSLLLGVILFRIFIFLTFLSGGNVDSGELLAPSLIIFGFVFYVLVFGYLVLKVVQRSKWAKFFALLLTMVSIVGVYPLFKFSFEGIILIRYWFLLLQTILLFLATILLFLPLQTRDDKP